MSAPSTTTTAVASKSRPENARGVIPDAPCRVPSKNRANVQPSQAPAKEPPSGENGLAPAAHLALEARYVVLVELDLLFVGLEAVEHPLVVALAAQPHCLLFRKFLARLIEQF